MKNVTIVLRGHEWPSIHKITLIITHEPTQKTATFPIIRFTNVTTKNDISWQFIWFFVDNSWKLGLEKLFIKNWYFSVYIMFSISWQVWVMLQIAINMLDSSILYLLCLFYILLVTITTVTIAFGCHIGVLKQLQGVSETACTFEYLLLNCILYLE